MITIMARSNRFSFLAAVAAVEIELVSDEQSSSLAVK